MHQARPHKTEVDDTDTTVFEPSLVESLRAMNERMEEANRIEEEARQEWETATTHVGLKMPPNSGVT